MGELAVAGGKRGGKTIVIRCSGYEDVCDEFREYARNFRNNAVALKNLLEAARRTDRRLTLV